MDTVTVRSKRHLKNRMISTMSSYIVFCGYFSFKFLNQILKRSKLAFDAASFKFSYDEKSFLPSLTDFTLLERFLTASAEL